MEIQGNILLKKEPIIITPKPYKPTITKNMSWADLEDSDYTILEDETDQEVYPR